MAVEEILKHLSPGQAVILSQGRDHWREVRIDSVTGGEVRLAVHSGKGEGIISLVSETSFHTIIEGGVVRMTGDVTRIGPPGAETGFTFIPTKDETPVITNRRETFRIQVHMKGKLRGTAENLVDNFDREWDITIKDISIGGLKGFVTSPPPHANTRAVLRITPENLDYPLILSCRVLQSLPVKNIPPHDALVRIAFEHDTRSESILNRYVNHLQINNLKKGLR